MTWDPQRNEELDRRMQKLDTKIPDLLDEIDQSINKLQNGDARERVYAEDLLRLKKELIEIQARYSMERTSNPQEEIVPQYDHRTYEIEQKLQKKKDEVERHRIRSWNVTKANLGVGFWVLVVLFVLYIFSQMRFEKAPTDDRPQWAQNNNIKFERLSVSPEYGRSKVLPIQYPYNFPGTQVYR
jgi:hypothetical protein